MWLLSQNVLLQCCMSHIVTIYLKNVKHRYGNVRIGFFTNKKDFDTLATDKDIEFIIPVKKSFDGKIVIRRVPTGTYAIALYQDLDYDTDMKRAGVLGIPKEPFGFSRNPKLGIRSPKWEQCAFSLKKNVSLTINLHHM